MTWKRRLHDGVFVGIVASDNLMLEHQAIYSVISTAVLQNKNDNFQSEHT